MRHKILKQKIVVEVKSIGFESFLNLYFLLVGGNKEGVQYFEVYMLMFWPLF